MVGVELCGIVTAHALYIIFIMSLLLCDPPLSEYKEYLKYFKFSENSKFFKFSEYSKFFEFFKRSKFSENSKFFELYITPHYVTFHNKHYVNLT